MLPLLGLPLCLALGVVVVEGVPRDGLDEEVAKEYLKFVNEQSAVFANEYSIAAWAYESNITDENLEAQLAVSARLAENEKKQWEETIKFPWETYKDPDVKRQFSKLAILGSAALSTEKLEKLDRTVNEMQGIYGKAKICDYNNRTKCDWFLDPEISERFVNSRDPEELKYVWTAWRDASGKEARPLYPTYVELSNEAAVANNFTDNTEYWVSWYDSDTFRDDIENLWQQLRPLYLQLHAYVRRSLREKYGEDVVSKTGPIPAHLLGNVWAQTWDNIFDLTVPYPDKPSVDVTQAMVDQGYTVRDMFQLSEDFYVSLNLSKMTPEFWKNSIIERPSDGRDLICHASAWDFSDKKDFRIKMCTVVSMEDLKVVHHEMGHVEYYMEYKDQPSIYRGGANPGFHEAIGDTMALSVATPKHLRKIHLLNTTSDDEQSDINQLLFMALSKIAFLPFGYLIDAYRWKIFSGEITPDDYNCKWWEMRELYQGLEPPVDRSEADFDAGAKFHVVADSPYIAYFVSYVIQFQFHKALCEAAGEYDSSNPTAAPLYKCDIYESLEAGSLLKKMLKMGGSKPWPEAMEAITGQPKMDASALIEYFSTLRTWLEAENKRTGEKIGWDHTTRVCSKTSA